MHTGLHGTFINVVLTQWALKTIRACTLVGANTLTSIFTAGFTNSWSRKNANYAPQKGQRIFFSFLQGFFKAYILKFTSHICITWSGRVWKSYKRNLYRFYLCFFHFKILNRHEMFFPLDSRKKQIKKTKTKMLSFYKQQSYFSQIVSKKAKITILSFLKNSNDNNIILCFKF